MKDINPNPSFKIWMIPILLGLLFLAWITTSQMNQVGNTQNFANAGNHPTKMVMVWATCVENCPTSSVKDASSTYPVTAFSNTNSFIAEDDFGTSTTIEYIGKEPVLFPIKNQTRILLVGTMKQGRFLATGIFQQNQTGQTP